MGTSWQYIGRYASTDEKKQVIRNMFADHIECLADSFKGKYYRAVYRNNKTGKVFAVVAITTMEGDEMGVKLMDETVGPTFDDFPLSYLKKLTPTTEKYALEWRRRAMAHHTEAKAVPIGERKFKRKGSNSAITLAEMAHQYWMPENKLTRSTIIRSKKVGESFLLGDMEFTRVY